MRRRLVPTCMAWCLLRRHCPSRCALLPWPRGACVRNLIVLAARIQAYGVCTDASCGAYPAAGPSVVNPHGVVQPPPVVRGDVARSLLYLVVCAGCACRVLPPSPGHRTVRYCCGRQTLYEGLELSNAPVAASGEAGMLADLLRWHAEDPPDAAELARNQEVCNIQGHRNPFGACCGGRWECRRSSANTRARLRLQLTSRRWQPMCCSIRTSFVLCLGGGRRLMMCHDAGRSASPAMPTTGHRT